jgi:hypothetical protein
VADPSAADPPGRNLGRRFAAVAVTVVAVGLLSYAARSQSGRWLVTGDGSGFGLRTFQTCTQFGCDRKPAADVVAELTRTHGLVQSGFVEAGLVTSISIWIACGLLLLPIVPVLLGQRSGLARTACRLAQLALMIALGGAVVFVLRRPGGTTNGAFQLGFSFWVFAVGNVLGLTAGLMLGKLHAPADPG